MLEFRRAEDRDLSAVLVLVESAYRGEVSQQGWTTEAALLDGQRTDIEELAEIAASPKDVLLLAYEGSELLGCVRLKHADASCYLGMFAIQPTLQSRGLGRLLLAEAERVARDELGLKSMWMQVISLRVELIHWYERRGYALTGDVSPFPYGNPRFGLPKRDDLEFAILRKDL